jgi:signal transduction histidine kinase
MKLRAAISGAPVGLQVALALSVVTVTGTVFSLVWIDAALQAAFEGVSPDLVVRAERVVMAVVILCSACTIAVAIASGVLLRRALRNSVDRMRMATERIARGRFVHRIDSGRRDELGALADSIDSMALQLEHLERARHAMLAAVSHELRTPLTVVRGHAFTLSRAETNPKRRDRFALIDSEVERLASLVDDLLMAASLQAGGLAVDPRSIPLEQLCRDAVRRIVSHDGRVAQKVWVSIDADVIDRTVLADEKRICQVIGNLVANGLRHADDGTGVKIHASAVADNAQRLRIAVSNSCSGVCIDELREHFEPFSQGKKASGAVGLGLTIARDLARAHGSDLEVSYHDGTVEFSFELRDVSELNAERACAVVVAGGAA